MQTEKWDIWSGLLQNLYCKLKDVSQFCWDFIKSGIRNIFHGMQLTSTNRKQGTMVLLLFTLGFSSTAIPLSGPLKHPRFGSPNPWKEGRWVSLVQPESGPQSLRFCKTYSKQIMFWAFIILSLSLYNLIHCFKPNLLFIHMQRHWTTHLGNKSKLIY